MSHHWLNRKICIIALLLFSWLVNVVSIAVAGEVGKKSSNDKTISEIEKLCGNCGLGVVKNGKVLYSRNVAKPFVPASIIKIATSLAALSVLGSDYRFQTGFFVDNRNNFFIQGTGDPYLISEEISFILERLKEKGITEINDIILDDTAFLVPLPADGSGNSLNPYDAGNSALSVNFNTINIIKEAGGGVRSAEKQTPLLPLMGELGKNLPPGKHRINIAAVEAGKEKIIARAAGELFRAIQRQKNIPGDGVIKRGNVSEGLTLIYSHKSNISLEKIIEQLMLYSNNFIANQLFLAIGAKRSGAPATWKKGRAVIREFLEEQFGLQEKDIYVFEGSGLSRSNRITPEAMMVILEEFKPYGFLLPLMEKNGEPKLVKSGTLKGVFSFAGYFVNDSRLDSFVLILNQHNNYRDRLLTLLERLYQRKYAKNLL